MGNDDGLSAADRWARTYFEQAQRFNSLRHLPGRVFRPTPMPPEVMEEQTKSLANFWPVPQSRRDGFAAIVAKCMAGQLGSFAQVLGTIPEPEASTAAALAEAVGFAAASTYAFGKPAATDEERCHLYKRYVMEVWKSAYDYVAYRHQTISRAGPPPPTQPQTAASADVDASGPVASAPAARFY